MDSYLTINGCKAAFKSITQFFYVFNLSVEISFANNLRTQINYALVLTKIETPVPDMASNCLAQPSTHFWPTAGAFAVTGKVSQK